jgi:copper chaperone CopZ
MIERAIAICLVLLAVTAVAQEPAKVPASTGATTVKPPVTKATFLVTGLHCPPCTKTVESSLKTVKGIRAATVDWKTKTARIEFDEGQASAQAIAEKIAATPHFMGASMQYSAWLALRSPAIKDASSGQKAEKALAGVKGVKSAKAYPEKQIVAAYFAPKGKVTSAELIKALKDAGIAAEYY